MGRKKKEEVTDEQRRACYNAGLFGVTEYDLRKYWLKKSQKWYDARPICAEEYGKGQETRTKQKMAPAVIAGAVLGLEMQKIEERQKKDKEYRLTKQDLKAIEACHELEKTELGASNQRAYLRLRRWETLKKCQSGQGDDNDYLPVAEPMTADELALYNAD